MITKFVQVVPPEDFAAAQGAFKRAMDFAYSRKTAQQWLSAVERQLAQNAP